MAKFLSFLSVPPSGEAVTRSGALLRSALAVSILLAGMKPCRVESAVPAHSGTAHTSASNCGFQDTQQSVILNT
jgi:hypothetical protein